MKKLLFLAAMICCNLTSFGQKYLAAAQQGDAEAQYQMGKYYYYEKDGVANHKAEAVKWFRKAADQGNGMAMFQLGICYEYGGYGVEKSKTKANEWYSKAISALKTMAAKGNVMAMYQLGVCLQILPAGV